MLSRNFAFLPLNFYIYMYYISRARSKINTLETKDFFHKRITSDLFQICAMFLDPDVFIDILVERFV